VVRTVVNDHDSGPGSLREAISLAGDGDTIVFQKSLTGHTIALKTGELDITKSLSILGLGADRLTVSGKDLSRVFAISSGADVTIDALRISHGKAAAGGAIDNLGDLTLTNSVLSDSQSVGGVGGGGIFNEAGAHLTLSGSVLTANRAVAGAGTDVLGGGLLNQGDATVTGCVFEENEAVGGQAQDSSDQIGGSAGGGLDNFSGATLTLTRSRFVGNRAVAAAGTDFGIGGALDNNAGIHSEAASTATVTDCVFFANVATGGDGSAGNGGAVCNLGTGAAMTMTGCTVAGNRAVGGDNGDGVTALSQGIGGGIINQLGGTLDLVGCTVIGNEAVGSNGSTITAANPNTGGASEGASRTSSSAPCT
jgi:hypothetical protein